MPRPNRFLDPSPIPLVILIYETGRVFAVVLPFQRIDPDISADEVQLILVSDDVFVVVPLPDRFARGFSDAVNSYFHGGFESSDERT